MRFPRFLLLLLAAGLYPGRALAATASASLAENYAKWKARRPAHYAFTFRQICFCLSARWRVEAAGDSVVKVTPRDPEDRLVRLDRPLQDYSIDTVFARIKSSLAAKPGLREIRYDASLGFPEKAYFDHPDTSDAQITYLVTEFREGSASTEAGARPPAPSAKKRAR